MQTQCLQVSNLTEQYGNYPKTPKGSNDSRIDGWITFNPEGVSEAANLYHPFGI